ncbi:MULTISPECIES: EscI/YscI/HrpB family type III secretion system inner rod protein [Pantoea]|uniref:EscI/YscI/HrpB family type III secretion system inner rod protein n=1 Tax=Pantoea TaxID=53335 RepID=UPI00050E1728|nr:MULTISPECIES: EscI/YscI/HrpB family type III secretion system inner rod protein [Pantoea]KGD80079.1 type III secretion system protein [Pantoea stewartii subsp. indologenes]MEB6536483.1 EscI/YscI/HrpB family type III secretion system inner rod protein [Pantoea stewartii]PXV73953.1 type III secretion system major needle protein (YscF/MxiH/PrgI family) [Pantoea sp. PNA 03-3]
MKINTGTSSSLVMNSENNDVSLADTSIADASWFRTALQAPAKKADVPDNHSWINKLTDLTQAASKESQQADRALAKASRSIDSKSVMDANRTLSSYYLESLLNAKLIGKSVQSLEKLTNLQ